MGRLCSRAAILATTALTAAALVGAPAASAAAAATRPGAVEPTPAICAKTAKTVEDGLTEFAAQLSDVTQAADSGNLTGAEKSVRKAGDALVALADDLRADAATADAADVRSTLGQLADEFESQGKQLDTLKDLQELDVSRIDALSDQMIAICGASTAPVPDHT
ncbi:hypothetical protein Cs7R123_74050 [Catellatospora sp. TT07R-123]|uniref:hypothetical protein n=1 Tax=Catellatospora sp. TT07R-123 TaxID=2733863 RepID=UPI001B0B385B|nr:hypothetical protein [Catellatospora sp. TT07R-123]GHJ50063.1 hypothetical protein Cs7R123_74050 [Catellatospora sp. TT07R-123]